ncbi:MAG TPA: hypothetical protein VFL59_00905 [Candidatus Nanopelagicales bacterium]|nr:hypothetical protein [Candidatus Nanopelagicales bacterium]
MDGEELGTGAAARAFVDPFEDTAPQPVVGHAHEAHPHHHEGGPGPAASPPGHHVADPATVVPGRHTDGRRRTALVVATATVAAIALVAAVGWALVGRGPTTAAEPATGATAGPSIGGSPSATPSGSTRATTAAMLPASQPTLVLGDSLGLIVYPYLADLVPDRYVSYAAEVGRSTANTAKALGKLASVPPVVIISSGTNDGTAAELTDGATTILDALGTQRCVVWVDVARPDRIGDPQGDMNAALDAVVAGRPNVTILRWSAMVAAHPEWLSGDGIHPTEEGARARAQAYADASAACSPIDPSAPRAERQYLPDSVFWGPVSGSGHQGSSSGSSSSGSPSRSSSPTRISSPSPSRTGTPSPTGTSEKPTPSPTPTPSASTAASAASSAPPAV